MRFGQDDRLNAGKTDDKFDPRKTKGRAIEPGVS
jgi:hypothetical protein